jgi:hypothetical protein
MNEVFSYPITQSSFILNNYFILTWVAGLLALGLGWGLLFRFGNFSYGIDPGCLFKTTLILFYTMFCFGIPNYINVKFKAKHEHEGDKIMLTDSTLSYQTRSGSTKTFKLSEIYSVYKDPVTFNPPAAYYVTTLIDSLKVDSLMIKEDLPNLNQLFTSLNNKRDSLKYKSK